MLGFGSAIGPGRPDTALTPPERGAPWSPLDLAPYAWWDAEQPETLTLTGTSVSAWADAAHGHTLRQLNQGSRPVWSATALNGRPGILFDGTDDHLEIAPVPAGIPAGSGAYELWALVSQDTAGSSLMQRHIFSAGGPAASSRRFRRLQEGGVSRLGALTGDGSGTAAVIDGNEFSGIHVARAVFGSTQTGVRLDDLASASPVAIVPSTAQTRLRIGAHSEATPGNFWLGPINTFLITPILTASEAALLLAYLKARGGIT